MRVTLSQNPYELFEDRKTWGWMILGIEAGW